jgi:hypothetical protein
MIIVLRSPNGVMVSRQSPSPSTLSSLQLSFNFFFCFLNVFAHDEGVINDVGGDLGRRRRQQCAGGRLIFSGEYIS